MATLLRMPEVAAGASEAVLSEWLVKENDPFRAGDPIAVIETDKASVELAAEEDATILRALVPGGTSVEVGSPMAVLGAGGEEAGDLDRVLADLGVAGTSAPAPAPARREVPAPAPEPVPADTARRVFISPLARKLLKEAGLAPERVPGTGPNGRIVRRDVEQAIAAARQHATAPTAPSSATAPAEPVAGDGFQEIPHSRPRRAIAARLTESKRTVPHFYLKRTARVDELLALRQRLNAVSPHKISVNDLVLRAVAVAHQEVPEANVVWTDDALRQFDSADIAVAIAAGRGLVTPVLRGVEKSTPSAIAAQVRKFARQADDGTLRQSDLEGGSISVTNLGMYGVEEFSAIINPPHSAILAVGAAVATPVVVDGAVGVATQLTLVLSVDHRAIDGALAARWMAALVRTLEEPLRLVA
ncbi:2-oxo acid dehydrogenase subunit E2 [Amycolatopsis acidiphila]|uniref:Dihydrolipoamide acetyltransferase component of pyruvate dehydrogenase complex n=1 Tax=Amycolatopsis acidiphila TaxID=715473 RepID=A0A558APA3_9PSEU|nr:dihydrolipoamide acetyltransferase family protein [Amycolatopsis acidiphila]TVT26072.1 2-oxo acid dehydrogenase subunit E2 [Amycolatopsis acidiphila]UIJ63202.1 2-oxo acid dehydrogenase subunit E2 [Amycolatopsis acidiphila]GHG74317.1 acetyltransferase component of pyruvate dehydrogenase complex [Amycolatopsis acidiphila]